MNGIPVTSRDFGQLLWTVSWQAAVLAVFVAVVCRLLRRQLKPGWQFALWALVFVRLACPVLPTSGFSVQNLLAGPETPSSLTTDTPDRTSVERTAEQGSEPRFSEDEVVVVESEFNAPQEASDSGNQNPSADTAVVSRFEFSFWPMVMVLWGTIASLLLVRQFRLWRNLVRISSEWRDVTDVQSLAVLEECCRNMKLRHSVRLLQADGPVGPAVLGVWNPCIVLPANVLASVSKPELQMLLLHELQHIRRWDVMWDRLATLLVIVHWFNPFAWWAGKCIRDAREQACDAAVLGQLGAEQAKPYGHLVMTLAERQHHRAVDAVLVGMLGRSHSLSRRIESIAEYRPSSVQHVAIGLALIVLLIAGGLTSAQQTQANSSNENSPSETVGKDKTQQQPYALIGVCRDGNDKPLAGVRVRLFQVSKKNQTRELVKEIRTETDGTFRFEELPAPQRVDVNYGVFNGLPFFDPFYIIAADKPGYASALIDHRFPQQVKDRIGIKMLKAGKLSGRVVDPQGNPIASADVFVRSFPSYDPIENLMSTKTDADGRYVLDDLPLRASNEETTTDSEGGSYGVVTEVLFRVTHPDYGRVHPTYSFVPSQVDVTLEPAARVEGTLVDQVTGQPASGVRIELRGVHPSNDWDSTTTDEQGRYAFPNLSKGQYNIWAEAPDRTCVAIESFQVAAGTTYESLNLELIEGSWIRGKIVDDTTGTPVTESDGYPLQIRGYGPSHPRPGASYGAKVDENGEFSVRVAPGTNFIHISPYTIWRHVLDHKKYDQGIEVGEDEPTSLEFRVQAEGSPKTASLKDTPDSTDATANEPATTGTFSGMIRFQGKAPVLPPLVKQGAKIKNGGVVAAAPIPDESLVVNPKNQGIANVFVFLRQAPPVAFESAEKLTPVVLKCQQFHFHPHAQVMRLGQTVQIDNQDHSPHNIHDQPIKNRPRNLVIDPKNKISYVYTRTEKSPVRITSDFYPWMNAWHLPLDHPYAVVTDENGEFKVENLPTGTHTFRIWHEKAGWLERSYEITIKANENTKATLQYPAARFED